MSAQLYKIDGMANLQKIIKDMPEHGMRKPVRTAFRKSGEVVKRAMANSLPSNMKQIRKVIKIKEDKVKSAGLTVGFYANTGIFRNSRGKQTDPYFVLYWQNYGTLANRNTDTGLQRFKTPRRKKTASWKGGIKPGLYVEKAWEGSKGEAQQVFEKTYEQEITKFLEREAYK